MPGEKTEQPTHKKIEDSRKKGQVFKSQDFTQAAVFLTAAGILVGGGYWIASELRALMAEFLEPAVYAGEANAAALLDRTGAAFSRLVFISAPIGVALATLAAMSVFLQVRPLFSAEIIQPKFEKLNPVSGFQNLFFKSKTYIELGKNLLKFIIVLALAYWFIETSLPLVFEARRLDMASIASLAGELVSGLLLRAAVLFLLIGGADFLLQKKLYLKQLMMSKEEIKQEHKQEEGDPLMKHMRKHLAQELVMGGAMVKVPRADVVVVNPTHVAVALQYDGREMNAPRVIAKGREELAAKIKQIAQDNRVPVVQNVPLARSLYAVDLDGEIPEDLYPAVAEILNWVMQLKKEAEA
jgi:flagellar biosynthesis protein FlhB